MLRRFSLCCVLLLMLGRVGAQTNFYATDTIQDIAITFSQSNWDYQMDTAKLGADGYTLATQVIINGVTYDSVGVRYKGNSSYDSSRVKNPLHIKLDFVHGSADYNGVTDVKLSNGFSDPTSLREVLAYSILRNYMAAPQCNFARVTINGVYYGVFSNSESIDKDFVSNHFYSSDNSFFKCNPETVVNGHLPNLVYLGLDSANYYDRYEMKSNLAWKDIIALCDTIANASSLLDSVIDVDRAIWMLAFNNVTVNLDSYTGAFAQNYYLYKDDNGRFDPVIWDLNMCFGGFQATGSGNLNVSGMQTMTPILHSTNAARPLIQKLLSNAFWQKMYIAHMRTINDEFFGNGNYLTEAQTMQTLIDSSVQAENYSLYTYAQFQQSFTANYGNVPGLSTLMGTRTTYLDGTTQFQQTPPSISNVISNPSSIGVNDTIWITGTVTNTTSVYLGYRDQLSKKFNRVPMYDDGLHHDGAAGDNVYGAYMIATSALLQYYLYAENANAGMFAPERAEYEFYTVQVAVNTASVGEVVINEFLASNQNDAIDEAGQHEDWIELYNRTANPLSLLGLYLTDDYTNPMKFTLPDVIIQPNSTLIIWADEDPTTTSYVHCNFKLSGAGESLMLSNAAGTVLDSISFGAQAADISMARCPNGTGSFIAASITTFNAANTCIISVPEISNEVMTRVFPNPAREAVTIFSNHPQVYSAELFAMNGAFLQRADFDNDKANFDLRTLSSGLYFYQTKSKDGAVLQSGKLVVTE